jgi:hypothetical protein
LNNGGNFTLHGITNASVKFPCTNKPST